VDATPAPEPLPAVAKPKPVSRPKPVVAAEPPAPVIAEVAPVPQPQAAPPAPPADPPPFPVVDQIVTGARQDTVLDKYGEPAIATLTSRRGHVVSNYVYARDQGRETTVIKLEDGKVATAYSTTLPPAPTGISAPRLWHRE
jgi:hypothetical protein